MSGRFEHHLVSHLAGFFETRPPQPGQILLAKFHSGTVTDRFAEALVDDLGEEGPPIEVDGESISLPAYRPDDGVPTYIVRVVPEVIQNDPPDHVVVQGFATKMRNLIFESTQTDTPRAMLMVMDTETSLDTLEASEDLFADDGPVNLDSFRDDLLDPEDVGSVQGRALLRGLNDVIGNDSMYAEDTEVLETLCEIRDAIEANQYGKLPELIGALPQFLYEDLFEEEQFLNESDEDDLSDAVRKALKDNEQHAGQLRRAHRAGTDTESRLASNYEESFVNNILDLPDRVKPSTLMPGNSKVMLESRDFSELDIVDAKRQSVYDSLEKTPKTRRAVMLVAKNEQISVAAEFTGDVGETPYECIGPNGNDVGRLSKRENRVTVSIEDLDPTVPHYARFQFYVGKKTKRGKPTHQFDLAIVPEWFYIATEGVSLDVDVEDETLLSPGDSSLELTPPGRLDHDYEQTDVDVTEDDQTVPFHGPLTIHPNPSDAVERISCLIAPPEAVPIRVTFLTESTSAETEEVIFPLMLSAIANPDRWAQEKFRLPDVLTIDTTRGGIYNASEESAGLEDDALELLQIEEHIITEQTPAGRIVESDSLDYGTVADDTSELPGPLVEAYTALFEHFEQRNTTPSTDQWDEETIKRVQQVLEAYEQTVEGIDSPMTFGPYEPLRDLGTIQSTATDKVWLTPFHPILLAYGLRIAQWRDEELVGSATAGFRREEFVKKFNPAGLLPYRTIDGSDQLLRGMRYRENSLWQVYSPVEAPGAVTPTYMERVIRDKLYTFVQAFPILFSLHPERPLTINLVNMGDLRPVVKGLYKFYKKIEKSEFEPPTILLRIYGGDGEGEALRALLYRKCRVSPAGTTRKERRRASRLASDKSSLHPREGVCRREPEASPLDVLPWPAQRASRNND